MAQKAAFGHKGKNNNTRTYKELDVLVHIKGLVWCKDASGYTVMQ